MNRNNNIQLKNGLFSSGDLRKLGALPVAAFLILLIFFNVQGSSVVFESPNLLAFLNTVFLCAIPLVVAYMAAKSHQSTGVFAFLMVGCGLVFFGVSSLYAGWVMPLAGNPNPTVTLHNLGSLFAGIFQFIGAHFFLQGLTGTSETRPRVQRYGMIYAGITVLVSITAFLAFWENLPVFFDPLTGASPLRQFVLGAAISLFAVTGLMFMEIYAATKTDFAYWYGMALGLIAIGLTCVLLQPSVGSMLGWTGRGAQYLGCVYFIFAFLRGQRELSEVDSSSAKTGWSLWPYLEQRVRERTVSLVQINQALQKEIVEHNQAQTDIATLALRNETLLQTASDGIHILDEQGNVVEVNAAFCAMLGYTREELLRFNVTDWDVQWSGDELRTKIHELISHPSMFETRHRRKDGTVCNVEINGVGVTLDGHSYLYAAARDTTDRKRVDDALQESEMRYRRLVEGAPDIVYTFSSIRGGIYYSPRVEQVLGYSAEYLYSHPLLWNESIHPDDRIRINESIREFGAGKFFDIEYRIQDAQGKWIWLRDRSIGRNISDDEVLIEGVATDITKRKQVEDEILATRNKLQATLDAIPDLLFEVGLDGRIYDYHSHRADLLAAPPEVFLGKTVPEILSPKAAKVCMDAILDAAEKGWSSGWQYALQLPQGERWFEISVATMIESDNQDRRFILLTRDVTERKQTEDELRSSEDNLNKAQHHAHVGSWTWNIKTNHLKWSDEMYHIFGVDKTSFTGNLADVVAQAIHPEDRDKVEQSNRSVSEQGKPVPLEYRVVWQNGTIRVVWGEAGEIILDEEGKPAFLTGIVQDITDRKLAEEKNRTQAVALEAAANGIVITDKSGAIEWINPAWSALTGYSKEEALGVNPRILKSEIQDQAYYKNLWDTILAGKVWRGELVNKRKDGSFYSEEETITPVLDERGEIRNFIAIKQDITERKRAENELARANERLEKRVQERTAEIESTRQRLELAVNAGEIGVWEANFKENKIVWDNHMHLIHGTSPDKFDNSFDAWWKIIHPQDAKQSQQRFQEALEVTGIFVDEHRILRADGSLRYVAANAIVLYDADHKPARMIGVNVDVTNRKQVEETMRRANLEMERALRIKDEFLANMSHELRTPLNAVMGISESLLGQASGKLNEKQQRYITTINESGGHLLSLINDILDLSKIEAGRMELDIANVSVGTLFDSSYRMVKEMAQKKKVAISFEADKHIQYIRGDSRRLLQMLVNLLSNAVKFTPVGGKAGVQALADPDLNEIKITVWDTGIGIAEENIPRLFQSFVQLDSSLSREYSGTGLGLMLVMQMVRMHGGNISVQSNLNEGSRFTISLPWSQAESDSVADKKIGNAAPAPTLGKMRVGNILLIEDTESIILLVDDYLQAYGHRVSSVRDGLSGLAAARAEHPDLILLDIQMPGMNGFEVIEKLRADPSLKDIPVIALTALAMPGDRERCLAAGMNDYISKPIHLTELTRMIEKHLQRTHTESKGR